MTTTGIPKLCDEVPGAPRVETASYYVDGRAPFALPDAMPDEDLHAIAARAQRERDLHGIEAARLGAGFELMAAQLDSERNSHQVAANDRATLRAELTDANGLIAASLREQLRLQHLLTARYAELATLRRQLSKARSDLADAQLTAPALTYVSHEDLTAQWRAQDAAEKDELERLQRAHEERSRAPMTLDVDDTMVIEVEVQP